MAKTETTTKTKTKTKTKTPTQKKEKEKKKKPWTVASIMIDGKVEYAGAWPSPKEAAVARDRLRLHFGKDKGRQNLKYEKEARKLGAASAEELRAEALQLSRADRATVYRGVYWDEDRKLFRADVYRADRSGYDIIGFFRDDAVAAKVRDRVMLHVHGREAVQMMLNFPMDAEDLKPLTLEAARKAAGYKDRALNKRASRFLGVNFQKGRWPVAITVDGEHFHLGTFDDEIDAARAYDRAALFLRGEGTAKLNFPLEHANAKLSPASPEEIRRESIAERKRKMTSRYVGVSWSEPTQAWAVFVPRRDGDENSDGERDGDGDGDSDIDGSDIDGDDDGDSGSGSGRGHGGHIFVGHFSDEEDAAIAHDAVIRDRRGLGSKPVSSSHFDLNFPNRAIAPRTVESVRAEIWATFKERCSSSYTGVTWSKLESKWRAIIRVDGVTHQLGAFEAEVDAARAYDKAALKYLGPGAHVNFPRKGARSEPTPRSKRRRS